MSQVRSNRQHNAHHFETATVYYRWHPLFGQALPVRKRMKDHHGEHLFVELKDGTICSLPAWMFNRECEVFSLGPPVVAVRALSTLRELLSSLQMASDKASLNPSHKEEESEASRPTAEPATELAADRSSISGTPRTQTKRVGVGSRGSVGQRSDRKDQSTRTRRQ